MNIKAMYELFSPVSKGKGYTILNNEGGKSVGIQKSFLEEFSTKELMEFIDYYVEKNEILHIPGHLWETCDLLARFLGFGYDKTWSEKEIEILKNNFSTLGAIDTAKLLPLRTEHDCKTKADHMKLRTSVRQNRHKKQSPPWMIWEFQILEKYYPVIGAKVAMLLPERTENACITRARDAGFITTKHNKWTANETEILKKYYPLIGLDVKHMLPNRSEKSIYTYATSLGIVGPAQWTHEEDELLQTYYPEIGSDACRFFKGRRSRIACAARAKVLGLFSKNNRKPWTEDELAILDQNYSKMGIDIIKLLPGKTIRSCQTMAMRRGLSVQSPKTNRAPSPQKWTVEELGVLRNNYPKLGPSVCTLLPGRTKMACMQMASELGLASDRNTWTDEEDSILKKEYPRIGTRVIELLPGRTKSACYSRAKILGIHRVNHIWSKKEDSALIESYLKNGDAALCQFPNRSENACKKRLKYLGVYKSKPKAAE